MFWPHDCLYMLNREWTLYKRLLTKSWSTLESDYHQQISSIVLICDAKTWSHKKEEKELQWVSLMFWPLDCLNTLNRGWTLYRKGWLRAGPQRSQTVTQQIPSLVLNLWSKDLVPQKRGKGIVVSELIVLATELSICAEQRVDFAQEMGDITQQISSLVVICDAKTRFYRKKGIGNVVSVWNVSVTGLSLYAEQKVDFIQEMFDLRWPSKESDCHPTNLFFSLNLWCKDLVPQKRGKGIAVSELNVLATGLS